MKKRILSMLLVLALLVCAVPFAAAESESWDLFWQEDGEQLYFCVVAPAQYVKAVPDAKVELILSDGEETQSLLLPVQGETERYYDNGSVRSQLLLRGQTPYTQQLQDMHREWSVPAGIALRADGTGNAAVAQPNETVFFYNVWMDGFSNLVLENYYPSDSRTATVGDTMRVCWSGVIPAEVYVDGAKAADLYAGTQQTYSWTIKTTGAHSVTVVHNGETLYERQFQAISSRQEYQDNLSQATQALPYTMMLPFGMIGVPVLNGLMPLLWPVAVAYGFIEFVKSLFAFTRIKR